MRAVARALVLNFTEIWWGCHCSLPLPQLIYTVYMLSILALANSASVFHTLQMALRISLICEVVTKFCNAEECISFPPEFSERFFGEDGRIYGYKGLKVLIILTVSGSHTLCSSFDFAYYVLTLCSISGCVQIDVWLHAVSFHAHANIHYDAKLRVLFICIFI